MSKYEIRHGLGGGFGGAGEWEDAYATTQDDAEKEAYECAIEDYALYEGMYGLDDTASIEEENPDWDEDEIWQEYIELRESWLDYEAREKQEE